jgi:hypothetical protein
VETGYRACPYCAEPIREGAAICRYCNRAVQPPGSPPLNETQAGLPILPKRPIAAAVSIVVFSALLLVLILGIVRTREASTSGNPTRPASAVSAFSVSARPVREDLFVGSADVDARQMRWVNFTVPSNATGARLSGAFRAFGGSGNDIQVIITDPFDFENWKNNHQTRVLYNSYRVTNGVVSVPEIPPGSYVLAFDNRFSIASRKEITGEIALTYFAH